MVFRLEPPDVTGSSLTLGTAGSRRTVYLIDDNAAKIADPKNVPPVTTSTTTSTETTSAKNTSSDSCPSTFLMFNRISNVIGGNITENISSTSAQNNGSTTVPDKKSKETKKGIEDGKETAIWYEYGCV